MEFCTFSPPLMTSSMTIYINKNLYISKILNGIGPTVTLRSYPGLTVSGLYCYVLKAISVSHDYRRNEDVKFSVVMLAKHL